MEGLNPPYSPLSHADRERKEVHGRLYCNCAGARRLYVSGCKGGETGHAITAPTRTNSRIGGGGTTAGECPCIALWPARPTPAVRQEQPRTQNRECGIQPAHQSLITDVLEFRANSPCGPWINFRYSVLRFK